jgi:hypothetical protein
LSFGVRETLSFCERSVSIYQTTRCSTSEDSFSYTRHLENLRPHELCILSSLLPYTLYPDVSHCRNKLRIMKVINIHTWRIGYNSINAVTESLAAGGPRSSGSAPVLNVCRWKSQSCHFCLVMFCSDMTELILLYCVRWMSQI